MKFSEMAVHHTRSPPLTVAAHASDSLRPFRLRILEYDTLVAGTTSGRKPDRTWACLTTMQNRRFPRTALVVTVALRRPRLIRTRLPCERLGLRLLVARC